MPIAAQCPGCSTTYNVKDEMVGKSVKCKKCQTTFVIGTRAAPKAPQSQARPPASAARPAAPSAVRGGRPTRPPVEDEVVMAAEEDAGPSRARKKGSLYKRSPQSNLVLVGACIGISFLLCGTPVLLWSVLFQGAASSMNSLQNDFKRQMEQQMKQQMPQGFPR